MLFFDGGFMASTFSQLAGGMVVSIEIFLLTLLFSLPLGLLVSFGRMSKIKPIKWLVKIYIAIMRGTPLMLQLIVVYFAPYYVFGIKISQSYRFIAVIIMQVAVIFCVIVPWQQKRISVLESGTYCWDDKIWMTTETEGFIALIVCLIIFGIIAVVSSPPE